jgi:hypothetical protein
MLSYFVCQLKNEIKERTPFLSGLLLSIHTSCVAHLSKTENKEIRLSLNESYELGKKMKAARQVGHKCAKTALWIPITRCVQHYLPSPHIDV